MKWVVVLAALVATAALVPATARGDGGGGGGSEIISFFGPVGGHAVTSELKVTGAVTIDFHGDAAAGCAAMHLCDVAGRVRWNPAGDGSLYAFGYRQHGKRFESGFISIGSFGPDGGDAQPVRTHARVRRSGVPASLCGDGVAVESVDLDSPARRGSSVELRMLRVPSRGGFGVEALRSRCAGPMTRDVAALLPARLISERELLRREKTLDFSADRSFSAHGFAGTLHSTVAMRIRRGRRQTDSAFSGPPLHIRKVRRRAISVAYTLESVSGRIVADVSGRADPDLCGALDSCGLAGSVTVAPQASSGSASLNAIGSRRQTRAELRRAVGLAPGSRPRGVTRYGAAVWERDLGSIVTELTRGGAPACSDSEPLADDGLMSFEFLGGRVRASYAGPEGALRTRCPGPSGADVGGDLATGNFPLRVFRHRRVTLRLERPHQFGAAGYSGRTRSDVTLVLRRTRVRYFTFVDQVLSDFPGVRSLR
jgi:hypothetical protein